MTQEIYKDIVGYEGLYQVSNYGNVKSLGNDKTRKEKIKNPKKHKDGYLQVTLYKDEKPKNFTVHRLVALHFIPNLLNLPQVNHKDENKTNNCVDNLEWCDAKYNINYGSRTEKVAEKRSKIVYQYSLSGEFIREWKSATEIEKELGYFQTNISKCCLGRPHFKSAYGFIWSYEKRESRN